jgi:hypothetical protein
MRGFAAPDPDLGVVVMRADYRPSPFGGWIAALGPEGTGPAQEHHFPDPHSAYHGVLELLDTLEEDTGVPLAVRHTPTGDPAAWQHLADQHGLTYQPGCEPALF